MNPSLNPEQQKLEEYYKTKIKDAFNLFVDNKNGFVKSEEIPYIMQYLGRFPSKAQVTDVILRDLEEDDPVKIVKYTTFEPYMLKILMNQEEKEYEPDDSETLIAAFKLLDPENKGYIEVDTIKEQLETQGIKFLPVETEEFLKFAAVKDDNGDLVIYYEDYVHKLHQSIDKHMESLMKGYAKFQVNPTK
mmetsp:Transcript_56610/g.64889  ORF Transcript_56610/g.64889 Transcript_56610/m.64889 type:complete len:190 (+) Transcript_56610:37-606(+)